ncbi:MULTISPECIES: bifunctional 2-polyprenyl-6-hydroxyphenol methylase/3-demethylubiquinol 3-O-methyltransferase UbiG [unclassified Actinotalea]|uniref:class I SAM-dependent methyltransferase n=1 Tax=unclassified Actinotalea TaxID=2638618 RepID=UPI0015F69036|nr:MULTISPECIES: class I SAM-dependent methyltransferase [unclassified Actinotalea]
MRQPTRWEAKVRSDPQHSHWYVERFRQMAADGADLHGEARLVDAMVRRGARVLDAGCGPGRVGGELARRGHTVVGVDVDPVLVEAAEADHPQGRWLVGDLAELDLAAHGITEPFDAVVCAGNVMTFVAPGTEVEVLRRLGAVLAPDGRLVVGFGAGRGYAFGQFFDDARAAGLTLDVALGTWDLRPLEPDSDFLVALLRRGGGRAR